MRHNLQGIRKAPAWVLAALIGPVVFSLMLLSGTVHVTGAVPGWVGVLALAAYASLLFIL